MMKKSIHLTHTYHHPIDKVWSALVDPKAMSQWLMPCDIKAEVGHRFQFRTKPSPGFDGIINCKVLEVIPKERLSFSWKNGGLNTIVTFQLEAAGSNTILHFEHSGFKGLLNRLIARNILASGWKGKLFTKQLPAFLKLNQ